LDGHVLALVLMLWMRFDAFYRLLEGDCNQLTTMRETVMDPSKHPKLAPYLDDHELTQFIKDTERIER